MWQTEQRASAKGRRIGQKPPTAGSFSTLVVQCIHGVAPVAISTVQLTVGYLLQSGTQGLPFFASGNVIVQANEAVELSVSGEPRYPS
jgi:hypothetical protein